MFSFTFHYVSIKTRKSTLNQKLFRNLHSTMYLLKRVAESRVDGDVSFTFHYVSIKTRRCINIFFHIFIYIPLCIY